MRRKIYAILKENNIEVFAPGQKTTPYKNPYVVVKLGNESVVNTVAGSTMVDIMCYAPDTSVFAIDDLVAKVKHVMSKYNISDEYSGMSTDFHDTELNAYMRSFRFKVPHTI